MHAHLIQHDAAELVVGLDWCDLSTAGSPRAELRKLALGQGVRMATLYRGASSGCMGGLVPQELDGLVPSKALALASLAAGYPEIAPDALLIYEDGKKGSLVALRSGLPVPGFDGHGSVEEVREAAERFISRAASGVTVYGESAHFDCIPLSLGDLLSRSTATNQARFLNITPPQTYAALSALLLALFAGAGWYAWDTYQAVQAANEAKLNAPDPNVEYLKSVMATLASKELLAPTLASAYGLVGNIPALQDGWVFERAMCSAGLCNFVYRADFGTNKSFQLPPAAQNVTYSLAGDVITFSLGYAPKFGVELSSASSELAVLTETVSQFQPLAPLGLRLIATKPAFFGTALVPETQLSVVAREGSYSLEGPIWGLEAASSLPMAASLETFEVQGGDTPTFKLMGRYYVK